MLQLLIAFIYELVQQSWTVSAVLVKYFVLSIGVATLLDDERSFQKFLDSLTEYSPFFVTSIVVLGFVNILTGFFEEPFLLVFSEVTAFLYFLFLFWKY